MHKNDGVLLRKIHDGTNNEESLVFHKKKLSYNISRQILSLVAFFSTLEQSSAAFYERIFDEMNEC